MNQKDYKKIAEIIKNNITKEWINLSGEEENAILQTETKLRKMYANELADYFERELEERLKAGCYQGDFNIEKFLKDCGVKE